MKKSVFTKYIWVFFVIIVISFIVLAIIISSISIRSIYTEKQNASKNVSINISTFIEREIAAQGTNTTIDQYVKSNYNTLISIINASSYGNKDQILVYISNLNGDILISTDGFYSGNIRKTEAYDHIRDISGFEYIGEVPNDKNNDYAITVIPIIVGENRIIGSVMTCYNTNQINEISLKIIKAIVLTSMWVLIVSFIAIYVITEKFTAPLKQMSIATKKFSQGKFNVRLPIDSDDEIADLERAFNTMAESLSELEKMRSTFIANVSHDLRTPMTTISGFIDGILSGAIPEDKQSYYLGIIQQEIKRLSRIVSDLLEVSRLEAGSKKFEYSNFDIAEMARIIILTFENKINEKELQVEFDVSSENIFINSDKDCIYRIIYNICDNAVKFAYDKGIYRISINEDENMVKVSVYNEGIGISKDDLPHVFDRFYKSDKSRGLDKTGTGLGLYIAKTMLDNLNGSISVKSEYQKDCEFTIVLNKTKQ